MTDEQYTMWGYWEVEEPEDWEQFKKDTMTLNYYQQEIEQFIVNKDPGPRMFENILGLVGEAGEAAEKLKKGVRDGTMDTEAFKKELGDVLFYVASLATVFDDDLGNIAQDNLDKLRDRKARDVIEGSGDER